MSESSNRFRDCVLLIPGYPHSQICSLHVSSSIAVWQSEILEILHWDLGHRVVPFWHCLVGGTMRTPLPSWSTCTWPLEMGAGTRRTKITATEPAGQRICSVGPLPAGPVQSAALGGVAPGADPGHGGHGPHSSHDLLMVKETCRLCSPAVGAVLRRCKALARRRYFYGLSQLRRSGGPWFCCLLALRSCVMLPWSDPAFPQVIESDFSKNLTELCLSQGAGGRVIIPEAHSVKPFCEGAQTAGCQVQAGGKHKYEEGC